MARFVSDKERQIIYDKPVFYKPQMSTYYIINFEVVLGQQKKLSKLVQSSDSRFTPDDVIKNLKNSIWSTDTATDEIISDVVGDLLE